MRSVPLRSRLFLLAAAAILPLAIMSVIGLATLYQQQREQGVRIGLDLTRALATAVDSELQSTVSALSMLATSLQLETGNIAGFEKRARTALRTQPEWRSIILSDSEGRTLVNTGVAPGAPLPPIVETQSLATVRENGTPAVGFVTQGPGGAWAFPVRVPVLQDGAVRYVLTAVVRPESILHVVQRQRVPNDWVVSVFDGRNQRVARSRLHEQSLGGAPAPSLAKMLDGPADEGTGFTYATEGDPIYSAFSRSTASRWTTAIGIPPSLIEEGPNRLLIVIGAGILLSFAIGALAAVLAARALSAAAEERARIAQEREELLARERAARAEAEAANRSKDEFLAMLGHELRNPLSAISNAGHVLESVPAASDAGSRARKVIMRQVSHLTRLTDDLLDAGRALLGKIMLRPVPLDLAEAAAQSLATLRAAGRLQQHRIVEDLHSAWVAADPIRLDQVITNLMVNALKYTPPGGRIEMSTRREGADAVLRVSDDGIGLTPELAARAFDLFVQGDRDLDRSQGGLGIGLTLVKRLTEMHAGTATALSEGRDRGSTFVVTLPAIEALPPPQETLQPNARPGSRSVLVVEDNDDARESLCTLLEAMGHRVEQARDGNAGLELALALAPDIAFVDIGLPGIDGYELARRLRAAHGAGRTFLVALTGYGMTEDRERAIAAGFDEHVVKPADVRTVVELLAHAPQLA